MSLAMSFGAWSAIFWTILICSPMGASFSTRTSYRCAASQKGLLGRGSELLSSREQAVAPTATSRAATSRGAARMGRHCGRARRPVRTQAAADQRGVAWGDEVVLAPAGRRVPVLALGRQPDRLRSRRRAAPRRDERRPPLPRRPQRRAPPAHAAGVQGPQQRAAHGPARDAAEAPGASPAGAREPRPRRRLRRHRAAAQRSRRHGARRHRPPGRGGHALRRPAPPGARRRRRRPAAPGSSSSSRPTSRARCSRSRNTSSWTTPPASGSRS